MSTKEKKIYDLKLHERTEIDQDTWAIRVPGGWIYEHYLEDKPMGAVFVPFNDEFMDRKELTIPDVSEDQLLKRS